MPKLSTTPGPVKKFRFPDIFKYTDVGVPASNLFYYANNGMREFGSWIDENSRSNGYNDGDYISNPAYVIESFLRDVLNIPTDFIDY